MYTLTSDLILQGQQSKQKLAISEVHSKKIFITVKSRFEQTGSNLRQKKNQICDMLTHIL